MSRCDCEYCNRPNWCHGAQRGKLEKLLNYFRVQRDEAVAYAEALEEYIKSYTPSGEIEYVCGKQPPRPECMEREKYSKKL